MNFIDQLRTDIRERDRTECLVAAMLFAFYAGVNAIGSYYGTEWTHWGITPGMIVLAGIAVYGYFDYGE